MINISLAKRLERSGRGEGAGSCSAHCVPGTSKIFTHVNAVHSQSRPTRCVPSLSPLNRELPGILLISGREHYRAGITKRRISYYSSPGTCAVEISDGGFRHQRRRGYSELSANQGICHMKSSPI